MEHISKIAPFGVRMPVSLKAWLKIAADKNLRSMNSEIVARLEEARKKEEEIAKAA